MSVLSSALTIGSSLLGLSASNKAAANQRTSGYQQAKLYEMQRKQALLQASAQALNYREQGTRVLENINELTAASVARAYASGIDPSKVGETVDKLNLKNLKLALKDKRKAIDNATLTEQFGLMQANQLQQAAAGSVISGGALASNISLQGYATALQIAAEPIGALYSSLKPG